MPQFCANKVSQATGRAGDSFASGGRALCDQSCVALAGALMWCLGLMEKLRLLNKSIMEREEAKEVIKKYDMLTTVLQDCKTEQYLNWFLLSSPPRSLLKAPLTRTR